MNPVPEIVKRMMKKDSNVVNRLKTETYALEMDNRIWTFPRFRPINWNILEKTNELLEQLTPNLLPEDSFVKFCEALPDP